MNTIDQIYVLIHQDFNRLGFLDDQEGLWYLDPESYERYVKMTQHQNEIIQHVIQDENTALFVYPALFGLLDYYEYLPKEDRNLLENKLLDIAEWSQQLIDRFVLLKDGDFDEKRLFSRGRSFWKTEGYALGLTDPDFRNKLPFQYVPKKTNLHVFGEYTSNCVNDYGRALCRSLDIPENRFQIVREASIENIQLMHEFEGDFYKQLPGWGKERK